MLSPATGYAATALGYVAAAGGKPVQVRQIAEACGIPQAYLAKIIHSLAQADIVTTQRGVGGGVTLRTPAVEITLRRICEALSDPCLELRCMLSEVGCSDDRACPAHEFACRIRAERDTFLRRTTIADIAAFELKRSRWPNASDRVTPA